MSEIPTDHDQQDQTGTGTASNAVMRDGEDARLSALALLRGYGMHDSEVNDVADDLAIGLLDAGPAVETEDEVRFGG